MTVSFQEQRQQQQRRRRRRRQERREESRPGSGGVLARRARESQTRKKAKAGHSVTMFYIRCISWQRVAERVREQKRGDEMLEAGRRSGGRSRTSSLSLCWRRPVTFTIRRPPLVLPLAPPAIGSFSPLFPRPPHQPVIHPVPSSPFTFSQTIVFKAPDLERRPSDHSCKNRLLTAYTCCNTFHRCSR